MYSTREEVFHGVTHGIGAWLSTVGLTLLVVLASQHGDAWRIVSFSIYGATLVLMYLASTLYHSFENPRLKHIFKIIDHCSIYLLIAGTYTPFTLVMLRGAWGWTLFGVIWGLTFLGIVFKIFLVNRFRVVSTAIYVLMGWLVVIAAKQMWQKVPTGGIVWLMLGGLFYTLGVVFYLRRQMHYHHVIWHLFVLAGSICHYFSVLFYVLPTGSYR